MEIETGQKVLKKISKFKIFISSILGLIVGTLGFTYYMVYLNKLHGFKLIIVFAIIGATIGYTFKLIIKIPSTQVAGIASVITIVSLVFGVALGGYLIVPDEMLLGTPSARQYITSAILFIIESDANFLFSAFVAIGCSGGMLTD